MTSAIALLSRMSCRGSLLRMTRSANFPGSMLPSSLARPIAVAEPMVPAQRWIAVRNVSDPQIKAEGTLKEQATLAAQIYKGFGRWSTVCSAITCWALIAAE